MSQDQPESAEQGKLLARERLRLLLDEGSLLEDAALANAQDPELPADGAVTGMGTIEGRPVCVMAGDSTVEVGSWGRRAVEKILRVQEVAARERLPLFYLVDSDAARTGDPVETLPGRRGAGRIFHNEVHLSGAVPQICLLFGPSAAGGAYLPAFCDVVLSVSGYGDVLCQTDEEAIREARRYFAFMPRSFRELPPAMPARPPRISPGEIPSIVPADPDEPFDAMQLVEAVVDQGSFFEVKKDIAGELVTGLARIEGRAVGVLANQSQVRGGALFVDSAGKAARFIWLCDAFNIPLLYLADVPGFGIETQAERAGIIRAGARMISAVSEASVPRLCVVARRAYGAGLHAMGGPGFGPSATLALPQARIAAMGPEGEIHIEKLASELVVDAVVPGEALRGEIARRFRHYAAGYQPPASRKRGVVPV